MNWVFLILLSSCLSTLAIIESQQAKLHINNHKALDELLIFSHFEDYSNGPAPKYFNGTWVKKTLKCAGLLSSLDEKETEHDRHIEKHRIVELIPSVRGIPGRGNTCLMFKEEMEKKYKVAYDRFRFRASEAVDKKTPIPWMVLALYHRGMLGRPRYDWAEQRTNKTEVLAMMTNTVIRRFNALVKWGNLTPSSWVIDAGCGWGRFGRQLIKYLEPPGQYMGVELDEFELRAFIQLELGIEQPLLAQKNPILLRSGEFDFETLLRQSNEQRSRTLPGAPPRLADLVIFSSVLKSNIPRDVRKMALCHAAHALRKNGRVVIFTDCHKGAGKDLERIAKELGEFGPLVHNGFESCYFERKSIVPLCRDEDAQVMNKSLW